MPETSYNKLHTFESKRYQQIPIHLDGPPRLKTDCDDRATAQLIALQSEWLRDTSQYMFERLSVTLRTEKSCQYNAADSS